MAKKYYAIFDFSTGEFVRTASGMPTLSTQLNRSQRLAAEFNASPWGADDARVVEVDVMSGTVKEVNNDTRTKD